MNALRGENDELPWTAYSTGRTFNYMTVAYSGGPATAKAIDWAFSENATVGAYGPAMRYPYCRVGLWPVCGSTADTQIPTAVNHSVFMSVPWVTTVVSASW
jgi:hypothetical protein